MEYFVFARVLHILAVILWIGGVSMVTTVLIPAIKKMKSKHEQIETFERIEGKFGLFSGESDHADYRTEWFLYVVRNECLEQVFGF